MLASLYKQEGERVHPDIFRQHIPFDMISAGVYARVLQHIIYLLE